MGNAFTTRRGILALGLHASGAALLGCETERARRGAPTNVPRPVYSPPRPSGTQVWLPASDSSNACRAGNTTEDIEGPFFKANAPVNNSMNAYEGVRLLLCGNVFNKNCAPLTGATIEIWQADHAGRYDNAGFALRTKLVTDSNGRFELSSIIPGHYKNGAQFRPAHLHAKVHHPLHRSLTTQLYFEGDPYNAIDPWFNASRALHLTDNRSGKEARFDFVLE
jgi:protocatechuate 3,4-dioxygenase beta subunit